MFPFSNFLAPILLSIYCYYTSYSRIYLAIVSKHEVIFYPDFADVSKKATLNSEANYSPSSKETTLFSFKSHLFAEIINKTNQYFTNFVSYELVYLIHPFLNI